MAKNKTTETNNNVSDYLDTISQEKRRKDCSAIINLIKKQTGLVPTMWGSSIVGFGNYHYQYESGHKGDAPLVGIASRVNAITLYLSSSFDDREMLLSRLGKHKTGKGCIYIQKLEDIDISVLTDMIVNSVNYTIQHYPTP